MNTSALTEMISNKIKIITDKKRINLLIIIITIAAIIFLIFNGPSNEKNDDIGGVENKIEEENINQDKYLEELELRLTKTLKKINGAGEVAVFICIESGNEKVLATDQKESIRETNSLETEEEKYIETEKKVILGGRNSNDAPYVIKEKRPAPAGVLVVSDGAVNERVRNEIYEAVKALFGLPAHRIKISY